MEEKIRTDKANEEQTENKIDITNGILFVLRNWKIYLVVLIFCGIAGAAYCCWGVEKIYECTAVLYYPEQKSGEAENVAGRDLMDDALGVIQQERMLSLVEQRTGIPWKQIKNYLTVSGNEETGIIRITCSAENEAEAAECVREIVALFDDELKEIVPVGDVIILQEPEENGTPVETGWKRVMAVAAASGIVTATVMAWVMEKRKC